MRRIVVARRATSAPNTSIKVEVFYADGRGGPGMPRGYHVSAHPVTALPGGLEAQTMGEGLRLLLEPAARFSAARLQAAADAALARDVVARMIADVMGVRS